MGANMDLVWQVPYEPGVLLAKGKRDGAAVCEKEIVTSGSPAKIQLLADRKTISADGQDVGHFEVNVLDAEDYFVPDASNKISFRLEGDASIIAVDNGDPLNEHGFDSSSIRAFNGKSLVIVQSTKEAGQFMLFAESESLAGAQIQVSTH